MSSIISDADKFCSTTFVPIHDCVHTTVTTWLCTHTFVLRQVCAQTYLCPHTFVPRHVYAQTRLCPIIVLVTLYPRLSLNAIVPFAIVEGSYFDFEIRTDHGKISSLSAASMSLLTIGAYLRLYLKTQQKTEFMQQGVIIKIILRYYFRI